LFAPAVRGTWYPGVLLPRSFGLGIARSSGNLEEAPWWQRLDSDCDGMIIQDWLQ
jgi:hypothetical protein